MNNLYFFKKEDYTAELYEDYSYIRGSLIPRQINESAMLLFSLDTEGIITLLEGKILEILGIERNELLGISIFDIDKKRQPLLDNIKNAIVNKLSTSVYEHLNKYYRIYYTSIRDIHGGINGIIGAAIDITEQKTAEKNIKDKNEQISLLYESGKMLGRTLDLKTVYDTLMDIITKVADCDTLFVCSYDEKEKLITYTYLMDKSVGGSVDTSKIPPIPLAPPGYGIISNVIRSGEAVIINDYQENMKKVKISFNIEMKTDSDIKTENQKKIGSAMIFPITLDEKILGIIQVFSPEKNAYTKEQLSFIKALMQPIGLAINNALLYQNAQTEIKVRKNAEIEISKSLDEKELLLKEIHHRVKNNLQIVKSLLNIQSRYIKDENLLKCFNESRDRIQSIALIHELLYKGKNITRVDFPEYIRKLTNYLFESFGISKENINLEVDAADIAMSIDIAIPCGLLVNELVSNALKHAFSGKEGGGVIIKLLGSKNREGNFKLSVKDNGIGIPDEFLKEAGSETLGLRIIRNLTRQLDGSISIDNTCGTEIVITFPPSNYKQRL